MYSFAFNLEDSDYLEFNKFHFETAPSHKRLERGALALMAIIVLAFYVRAVAQGANWLSMLISLIIVLGVVLLVFRFTSKPLTGLILKLQIASIKKDGKLPFGKNVRLTFDEDSFVESTEVAETKTKYASVEKVAKGKTAIYIYTGAMQAILLPLSAFENDEQQREFLNFINARVQPDFSTR
ncbi:MAG: YcxB family protein [Defluviitaleaceae bacterium]|nr:YcxB family protein [Defluviitaleaceae bacterium]